MNIKMKIRNAIPDYFFIKYQYKKIMGENLNLECPSKFNEKLQWLKLYNRNPEYSRLVDKFTVKKIVTERIGAKYVIPTIGVWDCVEDIDFKMLPEQFVIKCTHDSGGIIICKDKNKLDVPEVIKKITEALNNNFFYFSREWPYKNIQPRILIEEYMEDSNDKELRDYKFYCFNGKPHYMLLATNRQNENEELCFDYFDMDFTHLDLTNHWHPQAKITPHRPENFEKMKELAAVLSQGIPHVRIDFYEANGQIYFGEYTFFDNGGFLKIHPDEWEEEWGSLIELPIK